jgi:hypothetical protein
MSRSRRQMSRRRALLFAIWMTNAAPRLPTTAEVARFLDVGLIAARCWRNAWLSVRHQLRQRERSHG